MHMPRTRSQDDILPLTSYLDVCAMHGGTVLGDRTAWDNTTNTLTNNATDGYEVRCGETCPDACPPEGFDCSIVGRTGQAMRPPSPPSPSNAIPSPAGFPPAYLPTAAPTAQSPTSSPSTQGTVGGGYNSFLRLWVEQANPPGYRSLSCDEALRYAVSKNALPAVVLCFAAPPAESEQAGIVAPILAGACGYC